MNRAEVSLFDPSIAQHFSLLEGRTLYDTTCGALCVSLLQVVNCWCTRLYVTSDVAVLCSFIRGGGLCRRNKTYPEMLLYVDEGFGGGLPWLQLLAPMESEVLSIFTHL